MAGKSFAQIVADCELLKTALEPHLEQMPHLGGEHNELTNFLNEVKLLNLRQKDLTGELRQVTRQRQESEQRGQDIRSRVASQIRGKIGFTNEDLLKFGIAPRRKRRKPVVTDGPPPVEDAPSETAAPPATE